MSIACREHELVLIDKRQQRSATLAPCMSRLRRENLGAHFLSVNGAVFVIAAGRRAHIFEGLWAGFCLFVVQRGGSSSLHLISKEVEQDERV